MYKSPNVRDRPIPDMCMMAILLLGNVAIKEVTMELSTCPSDINLSDRVMYQLILHAGLIIPATTGQQYAEIG